MQEQRVIRCRRTNSISLTADEKFNLVTSCGTIKEHAEMERVHPATVYRYDKLVTTAGSVDRKKRKPGHKRKISTKDALSLFFYKMIYPAAQLCECKSFLRVTQGSDFSLDHFTRTQESCLDIQGHAILL